DVVHANGLLLAAMWPQRAGHGRQRAVRAQAAVAGDREDRQRIGAVVANREEAAGGVESEVHGVVAAGRLAIELGQMASGGGDGEGIDLAAVAMDRAEAGGVGNEGGEGRAP